MIPMKLVRLIGYLYAQPHIFQRDYLEQKKRKVEHYIPFSVVPVMIQFKSLVAFAEIKLFRFFEKKQTDDRKFVRM